MSNIFYTHFHSKKGGFYYIYENRAQSAMSFRLFRASDGELLHDDYYDEIITEDCVTCEGHNYLIGLDSKYRLTFIDCESDQNSFVFYYNVDDVALDSDNKIMAVCDSNKIRFHDIRTLDIIPISYELKCLIEDISSVNIVNTEDKFVISYDDKDDNTCTITTKKENDKIIIVD